MNNDVDFYTEIVLPTVEEFCRNPGDIRLGVLACLVLPERCSLLIALAWASVQRALTGAGTPAETRRYIS